MGYYGLGMAAPSFFLTLYVSIFNATNSINASHFTLYGSYNLEPRTSNLELKKTVAFAPTSSKSSLDSMKWRFEYMPRITLRETITKEIEIPIDALCDLIDSLSDKERTKLLERVKNKQVKLSPFKKDKIESILADFEETDLYEDQFLRDLKEGLKKSSVYR
jgi:hypothetical protein